MLETQKLKNIGKVLSSRLQEIGVVTREDLVKLGSAEAHRRIQLNYPETKLPVCYYLYSLEGAIMDMNWREFSEEQKRLLREKAAVAD